MELFERSVLLACLVGGSLYCAPGRTDSGNGGVTGVSTKGVKRGEDEVATGYILFSPLLSTTTYLVDKKGRVVHTWESDLAPGVSVYLLDNGHLLRSGRQPERACVSKRPLPRAPKPTRTGTRASQGASAARTERGKTTAASNSCRRSARRLSANVFGERSRPAASASSTPGSMRTSGRKGAGA